jgi:phytoene synthase
VQLLRTLPDLLAKGRNPFGGDANPDWSVQLEPLLAQARASLSELRRLAELAPATILPAILPAALVEPYLAALENLGRHIVLEQASISPLSRMWRIFQASWRGRF